MVIRRQALPRPGPDETTKSRLPSRDVTTIPAGVPVASTSESFVDSLSTMKCPVDDEMLQMTERQGIEVDYCPRCRGVWLDRGELDKILERAAAELPPADDDRDRGRDRSDREWDDDRKRDRDYRDRDDRDRDDRDRDDRDRSYRDSAHYPKRKKKKSFLSDILEFGE